MAVRITSEQAEDGFKPTCGHVDELHFRSTPEVWGYFSVKPGGRVHEFSDSQFGHVFAKGADRAAALQSMVVALKELKIRGEIRTLVDYVTDMLQERDFKANAVHTGWLDGRIAAQVKVERPPWYLCVIAGAIHFTFQEVSASTAEVLLQCSTPCFFHFARTTHMHHLTKCSALHENTCVITTKSTGRNGRQ
jgi:acetyl-CoA carboxylase / biotin carboxylase 1